MTLSASARGWLYVLAAVGGLCSVAGLRAEEMLAPSFDAGAALRASQDAIGRKLSDVALTDQNGNRVTLDQFRGRPLVISPIYTACYHVCPTTTSHLRGVTRVATGVLGESSFNVLTIGFDTAHDTPERMRQFARARGIDSPSWVFASGDAATVVGLLKEIGFVYVPSAGGFDHMVQATIVDPEGRVYRQVYGQQFETPLLVDALKRLVAGQRAAEKTLPGMIDTVRLICSTFDPSTGRYRFDYSIILSAAIGVMCFAAVAAFIWHSWRQLPGRNRAS
jgi:protein SCO1